MSGPARIHRALLPRAQLLQGLTSFRNAADVERGQDRALAVRSEFNQKALRLEKLLHEVDDIAADEDSRMIG